MTERLVLSNGASVLIEHEMAVVPRCGSCFEPLFTEQRWYSLCRAADHMVGSGEYTKDQVLETVIEYVTLEVEQHGHPIFVIEEEP